MKKLKKSLSIQLINQYEGSEDSENAIIRLKFLSDGYNSHGIIIPLEVLKKYAHTILGKYIVAKYDEQLHDVRGHATSEVIVGYVPSNAEISFEDSANGVFAVVDGVISKLYANNVYEMYKNYGNERAVSVEFTVEYEDEDETKPLKSFNITGVTLLGKDIKPSCRLATSSIIKFSVEKASNDYNNYQKLQKLIKFAKGNKDFSHRKVYKIDKTKKAMSYSPWGEVDKTDLLQKIIKASNKNELVYNVYMEVENGWEESPSTKLKYPVMELIQDTFVYNRNGLSSALGYAKADKNQKVVKKIESIYKKLDLVNNKDVKYSMKKCDTLAIEGRKAWGIVIREVQAHEGKDVYVDSIEKDHIIYTKDDVRYRVGADIEVGEDDDDIKVEIHWDDVKKDEIQKMEKCLKEEMTLEKAKGKIKELEEDNKAKKNIIMNMEKEIEELKKFQKEVMEKEKMLTIEKTLSELSGYITPEEMEKYKKIGAECDMEKLSGWANMVKAEAFEKMKGVKSSKLKVEKEIMSFSAPLEKESYSSIWSKL